MIKLFLKRFPTLVRLVRFIKHPTSPLPFGLWLLNLIVQRLFGVNGQAPWMVHYTSSVVAADKIKIGRNVWVSFAVSGGCYIQGGNGISIGDDTLFAPGVKIISANHDPRQDIHEWAPSSPITIGQNCWIGANAVILPGVTLGDRCIVGAGAVVTKSFPAGSVVAGVPAAPIKDISDYPRILSNE